MKLFLKAVFHLSSIFESKIDVNLHQYCYQKYYCIERKAYSHA